MKSVGLLSNSFKFLKKNAPFLQEQVAKQFETKGNYDDLIELWENKNFTDVNLKGQNRNFSVPLKQKSQTSNEVTNLLNRVFSRKKVIFGKQLKTNQIYLTLVLYQRKFYQMIEFLQSLHCCLDQHFLAYGNVFY